MRLFVGVRPPDEVLDLIADLPRRAQAGLRWTTRDQWHVTLRFLGEVEDPTVVVDALDGVDAQRIRRLRGGRRPRDRDAVTPGRGATGRRARRPRGGGDRRHAHARSAAGGPALPWAPHPGPAGPIGAWQRPAPRWRDRGTPAVGAVRRCPTSGSCAATWGGAAPATRTSTCATWAERSSAATGEQALVLERTGVRNYSDVVRGALIVTPSLYVRGRSSRSPSEPGLRDRIG